VTASVLHELVAARAGRDPRAVAVRCGAHALTYGELHSRAVTLATRLGALGVGCDDLVGVHVGRGVGLPVALLGVLHAGAGFVPLAADLPPARLAALASGAGLRGVVTTGRLRSALPRELPALLLDVAATNGSAAGSAVGVADQESAAYVIHTSGSTGTPKGVVVPHRAAVEHITAVVREYGLDCADTVLQLAGESFDVAVEQVFAALAAGATLLLRDDRPWGPAEVAEVLRAGEVTVADLPTALFTELDPAAELGAVRLLLVGGEALPAATLDRWFAARGQDTGGTDGSGRPEVWNAYGPTETVMTATVLRCTPELAGTGAATVPIGHAVGPRTLAVLDDMSTAAEVGELFIGGTALARGYLGRPDLTAERFVPDPDGPPGARRYRTGDRVRVAGEAGLEFLGRVDDQVKVRGYRVEPGEIEHVLAAHPGIRQAAVVAHSGRLAAYLVAAVDTRRPADRGGTAGPGQGDGPVPARRPTLSELREWLAARLPAWMVPGTWVWLERLPVRAGGKVDRAALPTAGGERMTAPATAAPRTEPQRRVAAAFERVLGLTGVGAHDDFFILGGTSLLAARVLAEVRTELGVALSLHTMYQARTPAALAAAAAGGDQRAALPPVTPGDRGAEAPLSLMQEQIWFLEQLQPGNIAYNAPTTFRLHGHVDVGLLERAITEIVRRHEILRTTVHSRDGHAVQRVEAPYPVRVPVVDLRGEPDPYAASEALVAKEIRTAFRLTELPLLRWTLVRPADAEWELVLVEHHVVHDGWTFALIVGELTTLYDAFAAGRTSPLPEPVLQYGDFARWQHEVIDGPPMVEQLEYWRRTLADAPDGLDLPYERERGATSDIVGATCRIELPPALCEAARAFSRREGVTLFATMLAAYLVTLHHYTGQDELCVGSAYGNRAQPGTQDMPGMFVNPVVLRCSVDPRATFAELLAHARSVGIDAQANQEYPFVRLVRAIAPPRLPGRNPLFQAMFNFDDAPIARMDLAGARGGVLERFNGTAKLDLGVLVIPRAERQVGVADAERDRRITMVWEYRSDLLSETTVRHLTATYETVLAAALATPTCRVAELPTSPTPVDTHPQRPWGAAVGDDTDACGREVGGVERVELLELFDRWVRETPDAEAVCVPGAGGLTYRELDRAANRLAHHLVRNAIVAGDVVGVCLERGASMVVAVLATLRAGAAYLPIDPGYPAARVADALDGAGAVALLVNGNWCADATVRARLLYLSDASDAQDTDPGVPADPALPAYLIHTSGSTGEPKCVEIGRGALADKYLAWERAYRLLDGPRTHLQLAAFPFDVCTGDIVRALLSGGRLVICPRAALADPAELYTTMRDNGVDCVELLPSVARLLVDHVLATGASLDFLRLVAVGGEAWTPTEYRRLRAACGPRTRVLNVYGVTEATIGNTVHEPAVDHDGRALPIGTALPGVEAVVLDALLRPVGPGVVGQVYLGGSGLATGYRGRPGLTAERFVPHPSVPGARLYRTGDRARYLPDGSIEFLGRADQQVKVRGFRIELGEIETVLRAHPEVTDAVVTAPGDAATRRLVAHVVGRAEPAALGEWLRARLPEHMVPGAFVPMESLPRTTNGKLDRRSLPVPTGVPTVPTGSPGSYVPPRPGLETRLADIWRRALGVERVGAHDEFFALGGHSLLAARVSAQVRAELGMELAVRDLLAGPTVEALARHLSATQPAPSGPPGASGPTEQSGPSGAAGRSVEAEPALVAVRREDYALDAAAFDGWDTP
jgi:amino acid adenylation domain-containing protein